MPLYMKDNTEYRRIVGTSERNVQPSQAVNTKVNYCNQGKEPCATYAQIPSLSASERLSQKLMEERVQANPIYSAIPFE